ncbi:MAG: alpha/beta hydrolase [Eubacterium sp.]|nr:alpha/beta hydrolase [Eubacterium sp.]NBI88230.1 alpha/beta hydrolase [Lachnospiraceae bacterium]
MNHKDKKEADASQRGIMIRELIARFTSDHLIGKKIKNGELRKKLVEPAWNVPDGFHMTQIDMDKFSMEWLEPEQGNSNMTLLQLHGGGYVGAMRNAYRTFAAAYNELGGGMPVLTIDYRVAPEDPYPAALEDAVRAYNWLLDRGYPGNRIIVAGDSAGGGLALALCLYLRDHGIELPGGIIAMSPWTDMTASGESYETNFEKDPLFGNTRDSLIYNRDYLGLEDPRNPYISPAFGDLTGFPPMLIQVGSYEMLLSDAQTVAQKAKKQGVKVRFHIYEGMFHVFQMAMQLMPESVMAWKEVEKFLELLRRG